MWARACPDLVPHSHASRSLRAQSSCSHASGAHRGRTGVSLLQPLVAVGRCWLRAVASGSRNLGSGNSAVTFTARVVFLTFSAVAVSQSLLSGRGGERAEVKYGVKIWRAALRCSSRSVFTECRRTTDFSLLHFPLGSRLTPPLLFGIRSERFDKESRAHSCHFWRTDFPFWFFVLLSAFGLLLFIYFLQGMASCSLTAAGIWCWSSQDAGDPATTRPLTLRQFSVIFLFRT